MKSVGFVGALALLSMLVGCGGSGPTDADVAASVREVLAGAIGQAPAAQNPNVLPAAEQQAVMAVNVGVGAKTPNGDGSFDASVHVSCQAPGGQSVDFTQAFDVLRTGQGWALSAIGGKELAKLAAPCLVVPAAG
jgi:hypothetical protein